MDTPVTIEPILDSNLIPVITEINPGLLTDILRTLSTQLSDQEIVNFGLTGKHTDQALTNAQTADYWKSRVSTLITFPLQTIYLPVNWKGFYIELKYGRGETFAVGEFFPVELIVSWIFFKFGAEIQEYENQSLSEEYSEPEDAFYSLPRDLLNGVVYSDRVEVFDEFLERLKTLNLSFGAHRGLNKYFLESDNGWNLLVRSLPSIVQDIQKARKRKDADVANDLLNEAANSADIAHFLLCESLIKKYYPKALKDLDMAGIAWTIVFYQPQNIGYYVGRKDYSDAILPVLEKYRKYIWNYDKAHWNIHHSQFVKNVIASLTDKELENILNAFPHLRKDTVALFRAVLKDPRITSNLLVKTIVRNFCAYSKKNVRTKEFRRLNDILKLDVEVYINRALLENGTPDLAIYLLKQKRIPEAVRPYIRILLSFTSGPDKFLFAEIDNTNALQEFSSETTLIITEYLFEDTDLHISENRGVQEYLQAKIYTALLTSEEESRIIGVIQNNLVENGPA